MKDLTEIIANLIVLLVKSPEGQKRRNLRIVKKTYKQLKREFKKGGLNEEEKKILDELREAIIKKAIEL